MDDVMRRRAASFSRAAEEYERGRPEYPQDAIRACLDGAGGRVLDLGAGTGKLTQGLLRRGLDVVAVEPLDEMRARIPAEAEALAGRAEAIPLPDASVDAVVAGQAFHWFERAAALAEIHRVLKPDGRLGLMWNLMDDREPWVAEIADAFDAGDRLSAHEPEEDLFGPDDGFTPAQRGQFPHEQDTDADTLVANAASRSTTLIREPADREAILARVRELAPPGRFGLPLVCVVRYGRRV
jgi:SAM-dependent methyltransferase